METKSVEKVGGGAIRKYELSQPMQMVRMANVLKSHIVKQNLYVAISNKNYAYVEGWQFAGGLLGMFPRVTNVIDLSTKDEAKWRADVEIVDIKTDKVISRGFAICSNKETKKKSFDEYAVLSMAQTRAIGKAYRNVIGWVMKLAGYGATPAEEMRKVDEAHEEPVVQVAAVEAAKVHANQHECVKCAAFIDAATYAYSKKIFKKALCRDCQKTTK